MVVEEVTEEVEVSAEADLETASEAASADLSLEDYSVAFSAMQFHLTDTEEATVVEGIIHTVDILHMVEGIIHTHTHLTTAPMDIGKQQKTQRPIWDTASFCSIFFARLLFTDCFLKSVSNRQFCRFNARHISSAAH